MRRYGFPALISLLCLFLAVSPAGAGKGWCRSDPIVRINGQTLQIWVAIPLEDLPDVVGPISVNLVVPRGTINELVYVDDGFNGYGEDFNWIQGSNTVAADGSFNVTAHISVPMRDGRYVPMQVELIPGNGVATAVYGQTVGVSIDVTMRGSGIARTVVKGADAKGASSTGSAGQTVVGQSAIGGSAKGADAVGTWVSTKPSPTPTPVTDDTTQADSGTQAIIDETPADPVEAVTPTTEPEDTATTDESTDEVSDTQDEATTSDEAEQTSTDGQTEAAQDGEGSTDESGESEGTTEESQEQPTDDSTTEDASDASSDEGGVTEEATTDAGEGADQPQETVGEGDAPEATDLPAPSEGTETGDQATNEGVADSSSEQPTPCPAPDSPDVEDEDDEESTVPSCEVTSQSPDDESTNEADVAEGVTDA